MEYRNSATETAAGLSAGARFRHSAVMAGQTNPATAATGPQKPGEWFAALYAELRRLAGRQLQRNPVGAVSPTTLVHELYLSFTNGRVVQFPDRERFMGYAARAMRGLIVDFARHRQALKRGAGFEITRLTDEIAEQVADADELGRLSDAIDELATVDAALAELVDLKYFCGFSFAEIAEIRGISERTARRDWEKARLVLFERLNPVD
jgi:RNA polymerase sigma factor (TIGR02999 family)